MSKTVKVLAIVGSLRKDSLNRVLVETAAEVAPAEMDILIYPLNDLPMYDWDLEQEGMPQEVVEFHQAIDATDAMILATPEYNGSYSGVIKNAIDWASRGSSRLAKRPVVTMGGSPGSLGGTKAQEHLRSVCLHRGMYLLPSPTVAVPHFNKKIEDGRLIDEKTKEFIGVQMAAFYDWILRLQS